MIIHQLNVGPGGVPKLPVPAVRLTALGLDGDAHRFADHGGLERALCLYSLECITALAAEGHAVYPGALGENVTLSGLAWDSPAVALGARLALGDEVVIEITSHAPPCRVIMNCFADRKFGRIGHAKHPGWSRLYARVVRPGMLHVGHSVVSANGADASFGSASTSVALV